MEKIAKQLKETLELITEQEVKIAQQTETITSLENSKENKEFVGLRNFKLAYEIAETMTAKEMSAPEDFQETVNILQTKSAEELIQRKNLLSVSDVDSILELGTVDDESDKVATATEAGPTPHSQESNEAAQTFIDIINNN